MPHINCPRCDADISDSYEAADFSVGIMGGGWYCGECDIAVNEEDYFDDGEGGCAVPPAPPRDPGDPIGTPISQLSGRPGEPGFEEFCRIAKTWGYD